MGRAGRAVDGAELLIAPGLMTGPVVVLGGHGQSVSAEPVRTVAMTVPAAGAHLAGGFRGSLHERARVRIRTTAKANAIRKAVTAAALPRSGDRVQR